MQGKNKVIHRKCTQDTLYYCPPKEYSSTGFAYNAYAPTPCPTGECYQRQYNEFSVDSCFTDKPKKEELAPEVQVAHAVSNPSLAVREERIPEVTANPLPVCTCGPQSGYYCGDRATAPSKKK